MTRAGQKARSRLKGRPQRTPFLVRRPARLAQSDRFGLTNNGSEAGYRGWRSWARRAPAGAARRGHLPWDRSVLLRPHLDGLRDLPPRSAPTLRYRALDADLAVDRRSV